MGKERPLDYVPIHASIRRHRKTKRLHRALKLKPDMRAHWLVIELFLECADEYPDGVLRGVDASDLAEICGWHGDAGVFAAAMERAEWIRVIDGDWQISNWPEYGGKVIRRRELDRERQQRRRSRGVTRDTTVTPRESRNNPQQSTDSKSKRESKSKSERGNLARIPINGQSFGSAWIQGGQIHTPSDFEKATESIGVGGGVPAGLAPILPIEFHEFTYAVERTKETGAGIKYLIGVIVSEREQAERRRKLPPAEKKETPFERATRELLEMDPNGPDNPMAPIRPADDPIEGLLHDPGDG